MKRISNTPEHHASIEEIIKDYWDVFVECGLH
jgi:hypothetical protein